VERKPKRVGIEIEDQQGSDPRPEAKRAPAKRVLNFPEELPQEGERRKND
jgi:hypothetical protein